MSLIMTEEYKLRLERLGIRADKPLTFIVEDLLTLTEFLFEESEKDEIARFRAEIKRIQTATN